MEFLLNISGLTVHMAFLSRKIQAKLRLYFYFKFFFTCGFADVAAVRFHLLSLLQRSYVVLTCYKYDQFPLCFLAFLYSHIRAFNVVAHCFAVRLIVFFCSCCFQINDIAGMHTYTHTHIQKRNRVDWTKVK